MTSASILSVSSERLCTVATISSSFVLSMISLNFIASPPVSALYHNWDLKCWKSRSSVILGR